MTYAVIGLCLIYFVFVCHNKYRQYKERPVTDCKLGHTWGTWKDSNRYNNVIERRCTRCNYREERIV